MQVVHKLQCLRHTHAAEIHNADPAHRDRTGNFRKPVTVTAGTGRCCHTLLQLFAGSVRLGLPEAAADIIEDSLKGLLQHAHAVATVVGHPQFFTLSTIEDHIHCLTG